MHPLRQNTLLIYPHFGIDFLQNDPHHELHPSFSHRHENRGSSSSAAAASAAAGADASAVQGNRALQKQRHQQQQPKPRYQERQEEQDSKPASDRRGGGRSSLPTVCKFVGVGGILKKLRLGMYCKRLGRLQHTSHARQLNANIVNDFGYRWKLTTILSNTCCLSFLTRFKERLRLSRRRMPKISGLAQSWTETIE